MHCFDFENRSLATSLVTSALNIALELYIIFRSLSLLQPPRLRFGIVQDARIVQAASLLLFDLLVVVSNAAVTTLIAEFVPYSIGALVVLGQPDICFDAGTSYCQRCIQRYSAPVVVVRVAVLRYDIATEVIPPFVLESYACIWFFPSVDNVLEAVVPMRWSESPQQHGHKGYVNTKVC